MNFIFNLAKPLFTLLLLIALYTDCDASNAARQDSAKKSIILVSSLSEQDGWDNSVFEGFKAALPANEYTISQLSLGALRTRELAPSKSDFFRVEAKIEKTQPDAVVFLDEPAIRLFVENNSKFPAIRKTVLAGHVGDKETGIEGKSGVHFIDLPVALQKNLTLGLRLFPETRNIIVLCDGGAEGTASFDFIKSEIAKFGTAIVGDDGEEFDLSNVTFSFISGNEFSTEEMLTEISKSPAKSQFVLFYTWGSTKDDLRLSQAEHMHAISKAAAKRVIVFYDDATENVIGGYMVNGVHFGAFVGEHVRELLEKDTGSEPGDIMSLPVLRVNWEVFSALDLKVENLPQGFSFYETSKGLWERVDPRHLAGGFGILAALLSAALLLQYRTLLISRRNAALFSNLPLNTFVFRGDGKIIHSFLHDTSTAAPKHISNLGAGFMEAYNAARAQADTAGKFVVEYASENRRYKTVVSRLPKNTFGGEIFLAATIDITEQFAKNHYLEMATGIANIAYFRCDNAFNVIGECSLAFLGFGKDSAVTHLSQFANPKDYESFMAEWKRFVSEKQSEMVALCASDYFGAKRYYSIHATAKFAAETGEFFVVIQDVTSAKQSEINLHDANRMMSTFLENIPCSIFVKNHSDGGKIILHNKHFAKHIGRDNENFAGQSDYDLFDAETAKGFAAEDRMIVETGTRFESLMTKCFNGGRVIENRIIKNSVTMENGDVYIIGAVFDITDLVESQKRLQHYADRQKLLNDCLEAALQTDDLDEALEKVLGFLGTRLGADRSFIFTLCPDGHELQNTSNWVSKDFLEPVPLAEKMSLELAKPWLDFLDKTGTVHIEDATAPSAPNASVLAQVSPKHGIKSYLLVDINEKGKRAGFIGVDTVRKKNVFSVVDEHLLRSVSGIVGLIFERRRNINKIKEIETHRRLILDSIHVPIMLFDANGTLQFINNTAAKPTCKSLDELLKQPCHENFCGGKYNCPDVCPVQRAYKEKKTIHVPMNLFGRDLIATGTPVFNEKGDVINVIESDTDITDLLEAQRNLMTALKTAQESEKSKTNFLATMSHELRTPLNAVIGYSELTQNPELSHKERMHNLKNIHFAANALLNLINDILDLSKLEAGQLEIHKVPVDLRILSEEFSRIFNFAAKKKDIYLKFDIAAGTPVLLMDLLRLKQVIMNIVGNAIKFTHKGGIDVTITFTAVGNGKIDLLLRIKDTGIGITPDALEKIFNPFEQDLAGRIRGQGTYEGTGLGLPIVKRLLEKMGGDITVASKPDEGSEFSVIFREVETTDKPASNSHQMPVPVAVEATGNEKLNATVLIVDDILMNIKVLGRMLKAMGMKVLECTSGAAALEMIKTSRPDLVMTDLWMPGMNGEELARAIKTNPATSSLPVVVVTADAQLQDADKLFDEVLYKPITHAGILSVLERQLPAAK